MIGDSCTLCDLSNILKWYELSPNDIRTSEQHKRTEMKIRGLRAIHEDSSEVLIANLAEDIQLKFADANFSDLQKARSLMVNRTARTGEEIKVLDELIQKVDKKMERIKNE
jgi:tRNA C32,U32 (ribose-2'-O)-methylase TrmJ